ncbi:hypothetical protein SAY86_012941 [Trapa natans]|uniref:Histone deacetylase complex subunit SAP30 Sin3 binding domain-containing protein n=1 Tax=Trapa natans TaxID=22666 RepID=A0AAN7MAX0_TRANT|nr:hypothetical protein SAY86_012941 [Trapa natans]
MFVEPEIFSPGVLLQSREESGEDDLHVLPRHTKVIVTGNNRTKSVLVGLQGVVKKAVGLGGWHWLVLKNGVEVKLQRNALSVLEHPTGNEEEGDHVFDSNNSANSEKDLEFSSRSTNFHKDRRQKASHMRPWVTSSSSIKSVNQGSFRDVQSIVQPSQPGVNLAKLGTKALWRYCKHYKLVTSSSNVSREKMLSTVQQHFSLQQLEEKKVIVNFIRTAHKLKNERKEIKKDTIHQSSSSMNS